MTSKSDGETGLISEEQRETWQRLMQKEQLNAMEMMQEAAFTELLNKESLA